jgi:hypothetical protein
MPPIFRREPPLELVIQVLAAFGLKSINDASWFSKYHIRLDILESVLIELDSYYMPCKAEIYLYKTLTPLRAVTILRHVLKTRDIGISTIEKARGGCKTIWYQIIPKSGQTNESLGNVEFN